MRRDPYPLTSSTMWSNAKTWPPHLRHATMVDPVDGFRGLLGHLTPALLNCIEIPFETAGEPVPSPALINPQLWAELFL